jgi:hypothetical protein
MIIRCSFLELLNTKIKSYLFLSCVILMICGGGGGYITVPPLSIISLSFISKPACKTQNVIRVSYFWDVLSCTLVQSTSVPEKPVASVFRVCKV